MKYNKNISIYILIILIFCIILFFLYNIFIYKNIENLDFKTYDIYSYDSDGYNELGFDKDGYDKNGYDKYGYNKDGFDIDGYDKYGYDKNSVNKYGFTIDGMNTNEIIDKRFDTSRSFNNSHPFNLVNDNTRAKIKERINLAIFNAANEKDKFVLKYSNIDLDEKIPECHVGSGNSPNNISIRGDPNYEPYKKYDCKLYQYYQKCLDCQKKDPNSCALYFPAQKSSDSDEFSEPEVRCASGNLCPQDFKCINPPDMGGFGCYGNTFTDEFLPPIDPSSNDGKICKYPITINNELNDDSKCRIANNNLFYNENPIFAAYNIYGCNLYNLWEKCNTIINTENNNEKKCVKFYPDINDIVDVSCNENDDNIITDCNQPPDLYGNIGGFGCYNSSGNGKAPMNPEDNNGKFCKYPLVEMSNDEKNKIIRHMVNKQLSTNQIQIDFHQKKIDKIQQKFNDDKNKSNINIINNKLKKYKNVLNKLKNKNDKNDDDIQLFNNLKKVIYYLKK